jgi:hypothetical protein
MIEGAKFGEVFLAVVTIMEYNAVQSGGNSSCSSPWILTSCILGYADKLFWENNSGQSSWLQI